mmetsp:Transcript_26353/g.29161  ORF Transcript_26353/g.29161 Transcript_26353/m.29161 type:complete len:490 (-) Transcript_26353:13-1482(-)
MNMRRRKLHYEYCSNYTILGFLLFVLMREYSSGVFAFHTRTIINYRNNYPSSSLGVNFKNDDRLEVSTYSNDENDTDCSSTTARTRDNNYGVFSSSLLSRRRATNTIVAAMTGISNAELAWKTAVATAATTTSRTELPTNTREVLESGRAVVIPNWLSITEIRELRRDAKQCFEDGKFKNFILSRNPNKADRAANDRWIMPSFAAGGGNLGPFADSTVGEFDVRQRFKAKMASVKALLSEELTGRPTLVDDERQTHEMEYLRYGAGAFLQRHTDEHHVELKRPNGSRLPKKPNASRRSVTWMVYLNEEWETATDGGQLRLHERARPSMTPVGARGDDLQIGWLKATTSDQTEQPVFLDPFCNGPENETCMLYTTTSGSRRNLSSKPFANIALYLGGGDALARKLMIENSDYAKRLHLIDAPKSLVSSIGSNNNNKDYAGEDGGERIRDIAPQGGTLVIFDSVSLPHEVLLTNKERFGIQGWFHEHLGYS